MCRTKLEALTNSLRVSEGENEVLCKISVKDRVADLDPEVPFVNVIGSCMLGIFLDTETNGLNPFRHVVLEIAFVIKDLISGEVLEEFIAPVLHSETVWKQSDPASLRVNGLSPEKLEGARELEAVGLEIIEVFERLEIRRGRALFICQNPSFDRAFFSQLVSPDIQEKNKWPYHWLDLASMFFALRLKEGKPPWEKGFSKDAIAATLHLEPEESPHRALQGTEHLIACYEALIEG